MILPFRSPRRLVHEVPEDWGGPEWFALVTCQDSSRRVPLVTLRLHVSTLVCIYIYIYIERERERYTHTHTHTHICVTYIYIYMI